MSVTIPELIGTIETGSSFMIVSIQNNMPNIVATTTVSSQINYYWESDLTKLTSNISQLPVFTAQGTLDSLTITDSTNNGGISFKSDGITIGHATLPLALKMTQPLFANFFPPEIFLSTAVYTIFNASSGATAAIFTSSSLQATIPANNIIILPVLWYFNCTASGTYDIINKPINSVINWFCLANPKIIGCSNTDLAPGGWTNLSDCTVGKFFTYCPVGQLCGNNNCKGPCSVIYDDCNFSSGNYVCEFDANKFFNDTQWWESPYFIGAVIGIIVIIIIIIAIIIAVVRR